MEQFELNKIKQLIEKKFNWGRSDEWTNFHFKELKKAIEETTGDSLSEETLKRIFGKRKVSTKNYQPQAFTKMALIKFADSLFPSLEKKEDIKPQNKWKKILIPLIVVFLLFFVIVFISNKQKQPNFTFTCRNPIDITPYTATFDYDISEIEDSVFVYFGYWKEFYLPPENNLINMFYRIPGVYTVRLYTRSKTLAQRKIISYSTEWVGGYFPNRQDTLFELFVDQSFFRQSEYFYAEPEFITNQEGIDLKQRFYTSYRLFSPFNKSLDSLTLEARVQNNASTGSMLCYDTGMILVGDSGTIDFNFTQSKCSRFAGLKVSDKFVSGEDNDLSSMAVDMSSWLNFKIINENKQFNLLLDDQLIYQQKYNKPLGDLIGIVFYFFGSGKLDDLKVFDNEQKLFYSYDFNEEN